MYIYTYIFVTSYWYIVREVEIYTATLNKVIIINNNKYLTKKTLYLNMTGFLCLF